RRHPRVGGAVHPQHDQLVRVFCRAHVVRVKHPPSGGNIDLTHGLSSYLTACCQYGNMLSMNTSTAHLGLYDTLADWEIGYLLVELRTGRYTRRPWNMVTVAESREPTTTLGGLRIMPRSE